MSIEKFEQKKSLSRPSRQEAEAAVEVLLRWAGEDPSRGGLIDTPARYTRAFEEYFAGYDADAAKELSKTFDDIEGYNDMVLVKEIEFTSHCEHHIAPIIGKAHVAYWPDQKIVGISKLARIVDIYAKRLTSQENMTRQISDVIMDTLEPKGVAVVIDADHQCMSMRGVKKTCSSTVTSSFRGVFETDTNTRQRFLEMIR
ncbi:MAG: GTP cyclohydrolase I FolE [Alphaproteobacteria bacterium]|nr:GTP cyclohydrolase I FolE [Alphaproteobacteria bacterium]NCQ88582.1 GTP cyclohydrolase I FolE [Alphaproteobacteria bacterium]NCT06125.1 GTP cyclohydrolase I FolE [Alphaproteobacteria bacterium]